MLRRFILAAAMLLATAAGAAAQTPLLPQNGSGPPQTMPPPRELPALPPGIAPPSTPPLPETAAPAIGRVFCDQQVEFRLADPAAVAPSLSAFLGIWSDAAWTPQLCAALIVQNVQPDGTAAIVYAYGPMGSGNRAAGGVLHGTGIIRDGELKFQNNDGSQFAFKPYFADLDGRLTTPKGQSYQAIFKKTY